MFAKAGPVFLVLLQRPGDSQLWRHSQYESTADFLDHVITSFAARAPADGRLMVRPHPLDPGLEPHERVIRRLAAREGVADRVAFVDDGKLHEILPAIAGAVCVNSTAGLAAIEFGRPAIVLGKAMYDMPGLTHQGGLDSFWTEPQSPCADLYRAFRRVVIAKTQVNGAFATRRGRALATPEVARRLMESRAGRSDPCAVLVNAEDRADGAKMSLPGR
jgi:capsular polysaccharide export protein